MEFAEAGLEQQLRSAAMSLQEIEQSLQAFSDEGGVVHRKEADDPDAIEEVAASLGLMLPQEFGDFYRVYDCISFGSEELLAIDQIVEHCERLRGMFPSLPRTYLPFISDGSGGNFVIACQKTGDDQEAESGSVLYVPGSHPFDAEFRSASLTQFLLDRIEFWKDEI